GRDLANLAPLTRGLSPPASTDRGPHCYSPSRNFVPAGARLSRHGPSFTGHPPGVTIQQCPRGPRGLARPGGGRSMVSSLFDSHLSQIETDWAAVFRAHHGPADEAAVAQRALLLRYSG